MSTDSDRRWYRNNLPKDEQEFFDGVVGTVHIIDIMINAGMTRDEAFHFALMMVSHQMSEDKIGGMFNTILKRGKN